jgi:hypothetical protein
MEYLLTKTKIKTGLQCHKKLWFDVNDRIIQKSHILNLGNRFGDYVKYYYGNGLDLTNRHDPNIIKDTLDGINDPGVNVIYEAAFLFSNTLIRADVMLRDGEKWKLIEAKSSTSIQDDHLIDAAIQSYVIKNSNILLSEVKIAHINKNFIYEGDSNYKGFLVEVNISEKIYEFESVVQDWINNLIPVVKDKDMPLIEMGDQCSKHKRKCIYFDRCESQTYLRDIEIPTKLLPNLSRKRQKKWFDMGIYDLRDLPASELKNELHKRIQLCHQEQKEWINPELVSQINNYSWPRYFIDFETVQQGVPVIKSTAPYEGFPFQYSVHKWEYKDQNLTIEDSKSFLEFTADGMDKRFLESLIEILGNEGPIFTHNSSTEISALKRLIAREDCRVFESPIENIIDRTIDTVAMVRNGFYNPIMMGSFSLKDIVKVLPEAIKYSNEDDEVGDGGGAMIKWFEYTEPTTSIEEKNKITSNLVRYCAQDTINLYYLFKYITR